MFLANLLCAFISCIPTQAPVQVQPIVPFYHHEQMGFSNSPFATTVDSDIMDSMTKFRNNMLKEAASDSKNFDDVNLDLELEMEIRSNLVPTVWTLSGGLEGRVMNTIKGRSIVAFEGVPFAKPPIGPLRWQNPVPIGPWEGIKMANKTSSSCLQLDYTHYFRVVGNEDCLFLNVFSPSLPYKGNNPQYPVIVFIHGGRYMSLSGNYFGPLYLLDKNVILVTINYRLGILGFLSTGDDLYPGNYGLKDQAVALEWIFANIKFFGGDPNRISLWGQGAGGASVGLHLISNRTSKYVNAVINHSGSVFSHWALVNDTFNSTRFVASRLYCPLENSWEMVNCLRNYDPNIVVGRQLEIYIVPTASHVAFGPVIEAPSSHSFLEESPEVAYRNGHVKKVPMISGIVKDEGDIFAAGLYVSPTAYLNINLDWFGIAPFSFNFNSKSSENSDSDGISAKIMRYYFGNRPLTFWTSVNTSKALGDRIFVQGVRTGLQYHSSIAPTYGYYFSYHGQHTTLTTMGLNRNDWGVSNIDDLIYIFNSPILYPALKLTDPEFIIAEFMINVWVNFVYTGVPYYTNKYGQKMHLWKPITDPENVQVLEIRKRPTMVPFPFSDRLKFWDSLQLKEDHPFVELKIENE